MVDYAYVERLFNQVEDGDIEAHRAYLEIKASWHFLENAMEELKPQVLQQVQDTGPAVYGGFRVELMKGTARHSFDHLEEWQALKGQMSHIESRAKMAYAAYLNGRTLLDDETGEIEPLSHVKYTQDTIKVIPNKWQLITLKATTWY